MSKKCKIVSYVLLIILLFSRLFLQPIYSLISDCDETFNYWDPLNLLLRGFGKETWEYSPIYSIRSWAFLMPFYLFLYPINKLSSLPITSVDSFYLTRLLLGLISTIYEWKLFNEIASTLSLQIANLWMLFQIFSPGYFHASVELLPSSIAMTMYLNSIRYSIKYLSTNSTGCFISSLTFTFIASMLGWPFVLVLSLPLCFHFLFTHNIISTIRTVFDCTLVFTVLGSLIIFIDSIFYGKFSPVSWNILMYNVLNTSKETGPNIFGVEPWYYYFLNLTLSFPLPVLFFAMVGLFHKSIWPLSLSLITWITIFDLQPHKEERFLYPIYGLITLTGAIGFYKTLSTLFGFNKCLKTTVKLLILTITILQAISRIVALVFNYTAPLEVYLHLYHLSNNEDDIVNVCTGREWYHFPNSFFLPDSYRLRFVQSGFDGLLPGDFAETSSVFDAIRTIPEGMNNMNLFDPNKLIDIKQCQYFVDISLESDTEKDIFSPDDLTNWTPIYCKKYIDVGNSKLFGRVFTIPTLIAKLGEQYTGRYWNKVYGVSYYDYCLFERNTHDMDNSSNI
ncbi:dolichyl-P-Man:Man(6)GlcNAc(2)-PP-dolichol alpha-1,2-mannosyltransferase PWA37_003260 [Arxiozyma heterogenica]|uniref:Mannosyltransferase n=1 Tax=Arxiozyma heterogenica TaxID=278026 RepID=A0AAN7WNL6_9SACH|nr:hypothetical protein RI543_001740 [Kazachstania heterogenica]